MAEVELRIDPLPAHVRTARQVAVALARRAGLPPDTLDEVRLAVGEACGLAVSLHRGDDQAGPVSLLFEDADGLAVEVRAAVPLDLAEGDAAVRVLSDAAVDDADEDALPPGAALAVVTELAPDVTVATGPGGPRIAMHWPGA